VKDLQTDRDRKVLSLGKNIIGGKKVLT